MNIFGPAVSWFTVCIPPVSFMVYVHSYRLVKCGIHYHL